MLTLIPIILLSSPLTQPLQTTAITAPRVFTDKSSSVQVILDNQPDMFPETWRVAPINAESVRLDEQEVERSTAIVKKAITKYPPTLLKSNLKKVYVSQSIKFYDLAYGGTNSIDAIYISNQGARRGFTNTYLESTFHHEFSSILLRNFPSKLNRSAWDKSLPEDFKYRGDGTQSLREGTASTRYSSRYIKDGFLSQYSTSSMEEDFNMIAEGLFMGNPRFWSAVDSSPKLKAKTKVIIDFYMSLDKSLTESKFKSWLTKDPFDR